ncbi:MAG: serine hydrolase [Bacteroidota bacterium]
MRVLGSFICCFVLVCAACSDKQLENTPKPIVINAEIDSFVRFNHEQGTFNGGVLVVQNDSIVYRNLIGWEDNAKQIALTDSSRFYIASVSKPFTALAIMQLQEQGKLNVEDPISKYFEDFPSYADSVSLRHLLTHTSGIPNHYDLGMQEEGMTNQDVLDEVKKHPLLFQPGEQYAYSNSGYIMLGVIVEKVTGRSLNTYLEEAVFKPLGMKNTQVHDGSQTVPNKVIGTNKFGEAFPYPFYTTGAGGMYSTIDDLHLWERTLYDFKIISEKSMERAHQQTQLLDSTFSDYGFGWHNAQNEDGKTIKTFHTGGAAGYASFVFRDLETQSSVIIVSSCGKAFNLGAFANALTGFLKGDTIQHPKIPISIAFKRKMDAAMPDSIAAELEMLKANEMYRVSEGDINDLGYYCLENGQATVANQIFEKNTQWYPDSWNTYDSYAESFVALKQYDRAEANYRKALELQPDVADIEAALDKLKKSWTKE